MVREKIERLNQTGRDNRKLAVILLDLCVSTMASLLSILFVRWQTAPILEFGHYVFEWVFMGGVFSLVGILLFGTFRIVIKHSTMRSIGKLVLASVVKELLLAGGIALGLFHFGTFRMEVAMIVTDTLLTVFMLVVVRVIIIAIHDDIKDNPERDIDRIPVLIYGTSDKSVAMVIRLENSIHYKPVGFITRDQSKYGLIIRDIPVYSFNNEDDIVALKRSTGFRSVLFSRSEDADPENGRDGLVAISLRQGLHCLMSPKIDDMVFGGLSTESIRTVVDTTREFIPDGMNSFERNTKRIVDFALSSALLIIFSPLFLICYIAIKMDDGGPAIYKQERIGRFGRAFFIYKFRSMRQDAEASGPALYAGDNDPRLTKVGKFLRQHHLDELPQLWNVWKGDMAFVGYRPERRFYIDQIMERDPRYYFLYQIRPGVTSYSTLKNGYTDSMEKMLRRLEFDLSYLRHRSWWFDIKILWQTFVNIAFGKKF